MTLELCEAQALNPTEAREYATFLGGIIQPNFMAAEVGTWKGYSASILAKLLKDVAGHLYVVDHWQGIVGWEQEARERDIFRVFTRNMQLLGVDSVIHPLVMDSPTAARIFQDSILDYVFIDADHSYSAVKDDITLWKPKLKQGGILAGHDYTHPSVERACTEILGEVNKLLDTSIWWVKLD